MNEVTSLNIALFKQLFGVWLNEEGHDDEIVAYAIECIRRASNQVQTITLNFDSPLSGITVLVRTK